MKLTISRTFYHDNVTLGKLQIEHLYHKPVFTLEEPWNDNKPSISCIPEGNYRCIPHGWKGEPVRMKQCWEITGVLGRSAILIHVGNTVKDIEGCVLVGLSTGQLNGRPAVLQSRLAMDMLRGFIGPQSFDLAIN